MGLTGRGAATSTLVAALLIASTAACSGDDSDNDALEGVPATSEPTFSTEVTTSSAPSARTDGALTIGTLLPETGPGNEIGIAGINAVNVGIREINEAGGVLGQEVRWVNSDEGATPEEARTGIERLLTDRVDAIIGPASSLVALEVLDELMAAGVLVCSPAATALALNDYPDRDRFFRTVPSDSLTAQAIGAVALNTGVPSYAVVYLDDQFGRPFAQQTIDRLDRPETAEIHERPFSSDATPEELAEIATEVAELAPRTIVVIGDSDHGWAMLQALAEPFASDPPFVFINDAMRNPPSIDVVVDLPTAFREAIRGLSPVVPPVPPEPAGAYATNALDCLNLIALATAEAGTDDPTAIAGEMDSVSLGGTQCNSFAECVGIGEEDRTYNYQGPNSIDFSARGDPARGDLGTFRFDASGLDVPDAPVTITELIE